MKSRKYRLNNHFIIFKNDKNEFVAGLRDSGVLIELDPGVLARLVEADSKKPFTYDGLLRILNLDKKAAGVDKLFNTLCDAGIIVPSDQVAEKPKDGQQLSWEKNGWLTAKLYHESVVYSSFLYGDQDGWQQQVKAMSDIHESGEAPEMVKTYPGKEEISLPLPATEQKVSFFDVLEKRETIRSFKRDTPVSGQLVADILYHAARAKKVYDTEFFGPLMRRTSPSGGSMHPVEIYPQLINIEGLPNGNYHYDARNHSLIQLSTEIETELLYELSQRQIRLIHNFVAFIITARFVRNFWKYRYAKSYQFTLFDVGHFVQTLVLTCEAMGLKCFLTPALNVSIAQKHLQLENIFDESPVYLVVAG